MEIKVEMTASQDTRIYHSKETLTDKVQEMGRKHQKNRGPFLSMILDIHGVLQAQVIPTAVIVSKGAMFEWSEVEPKILAVMEAFHAPLPTLFAELLENKYYWMQPVKGLVMAGPFEDMESAQQAKHDSDWKLARGKKRQV